MKKFTLKKVVRRTSLRSLPDGIRNRKLKAAVTLEAALVLPVFIFFVLNMFSLLINDAKICEVDLPEVVYSNIMNLIHSKSESLKNIKECEQNLIKIL